LGSVPERKLFDKELFKPKKKKKSLGDQKGKKKGKKKRKKERKNTWYSILLIETTEPVLDQIIGYYLIS